MYVAVKSNKAVERFAFESALNMLIDCFTKSDVFPPKSRYAAPNPALFSILPEKLPLAFAAKGKPPIDAANALALAGYEICAETVTCLPIRV
jgi:hypothetical protein